MAESRILTAEQEEKRRTRRVAYATIIGTTIEWYDFFIYASAAGLIFTKLSLHLPGLLLQRF